MDKEIIISREEHGVGRSSISDAALEIVDKLQQAQYEAYLVGGCVRDLLLGKSPKDFDVATSASPEQVKEEFRSCRLIGRRFRLAHVRIGREVTEVATFRAGPEDRDTTSADEHNEGRAGQLTRDNVFGNRGEDALRRDFTVNGLYYDPSTETIIDHVGGVEDLNKRILRSLGDPKVRFREDPVRMLRIVRFAAKLDFSMDPEAESVISEMAKLLNHVPPARMYEEVLKLFHGGAALRTFEMLREYSLFKYLFPFTEHCISGTEPGLPERALANTDRRVHEGKPVIPAFLIACLLWDPVREDAEKLLFGGTEPGQAWKIAMEDTIRDQCQYVAIPRRLSAIVLEIWGLQASMARRQGRTAKGCLTHRRFRAAYDFLLLRAELNEIDPEIAEWWTQIQEVEEEEQQAMISALGNQSQSPIRGGNTYMPQGDGDNRKPSSGRRRKRRGKGGPGGGQANQQGGGQRTSQGDGRGSGQRNSQRNSQKNGQEDNIGNVEVHHGSPGNGQGKEEQGGGPKRKSNNPRRRRRRSRRGGGENSQSAGNAGGQQINAAAGKQSTSEGNQRGQHSSRRRNRGPGAQ